MHLTPHEGPKRGRHVRQATRHPRLRHPRHQRVRRVLRRRVGSGEHRRDPRPARPRSTGRVADQQSVHVPRHLRPDRPGAGRTRPVRSEGRHRALRAAPHLADRARTRRPHLVVHRRGPGRSRRRRPRVHRPPRRPRASRSPRSAPASTSASSSSRPSPMRSPPCSNGWRPADPGPTDSTCLPVAARRQPSSADDRPLAAPLAPPSTLPVASPSGPIAGLSLEG
jgi:hypothetical protein